MSESQERSSNKHVAFRIQLTSPSKARLVEMSKQLGMSQLAMTSKMVEWFANQPAMLQMAVLGLYPDPIKKEVATMIVEKLKEAKANRS